MEELAIKEKAKRYDEALEKARSIRFGNPQSGTANTVCEEIFPELKESEDEKIRKAIIFYLGDMPEDTELRNGVTNRDVLAWLEKQGEPSIKWNKNTEGNKPQVNHSVLMKTTHSIAEGEWKGEYWEQYRWAGIVRDSDVLSWMELSSLEKQGEQKPTLRERYKNIAESEWFKKTHEGMSVSDDEKVDNVNKIEPKFKVGDWITDGEAVFHITSYDIDYGYQLETPKGTLFHSSDENVENKYHLWSIQNAKDGDVLAEDTCTFIIKKLNHDLTAEIYCCLYDDGDFELNSNLGFDDTCTYPATKEQRDLLFKKMKEAGYEWDADKKELKKADVELTDFEKSLKHIMIETLECGDTHNLKADAEMLLRFAQKPAWSEEDEKEYKYVLKFVDNILNNCGNKKDYEHCKRCYDWLKSLKQRIGG